MDRIFSNNFEKDQNNIHQKMDMEAWDRQNQGHTPDWNCKKCGYLVFGSKYKCGKCGTGKDGQMVQREGDWYCSNCKTFIFAVKLIY